MYARSQQVPLELELQGMQTAWQAYWDLNLGPLEEQVAPEPNNKI